MQGQHPKHRGESDPGLLGTVERYFIEIMDIPRLQERIDCFVFTRTFAANADRVRRGRPSPGPLNLQSRAAFSGLPCNRAIYPCHIHRQVRPGGLFFGYALAMLWGAGGVRRIILAL